MRKVLSTSFFIAILTMGVVAFSAEEKSRLFVYT
jgi:hypothetical protein